MNHMVGFVDAPALQSGWYPVAESIQVDPGPMLVRLLGRDFVLWRSGGTVAAAPDRCPHREMPLSAGSVDDETLVCPYHGWSFDGAGHCVSVPSSGPDAKVPPAAHLPCVHAEERYGLVWLCPGEPSSPIPTIIQDDDEAFRRLNTGMDIWRVSATRMVDNFLDISHFPWVHTGTFGAGGDPVVPRLELEQLDDGFFGYAYEVDANNPDEALATTGVDDTVVHRHMTTGFYLPFLVRSTIRYEDGLEHILLLVSTPCDDTTTMFTFVVWRNDDHSVDPEEILVFDRAIGAEDKQMLEQIPGVLGFERTGLVSVQSDKPSVEWRRRFVDLLVKNP